MRLALVSAAFELLHLGQNLINGPFPEKCAIEFGLLLCVSSLFLLVPFDLVFILCGRFEQGMLISLHGRLKVRSLLKLRG